MILSKVSYVMTLTVVRSVTKICKETSPSMINILKKGLKTLKKHIASCKTQLEANLKAETLFMQMTKHSMRMQWQIMAITILTMTHL